ncbi:hypothetical protein D3C87_1575650 [compost metagenome]
MRVSPVQHVKQDVLLVLRPRLHADLIQHQQADVAQQADRLVLAALRIPAPGAAHRAHHVRHPHVGHRGLADHGLGRRQRQVAFAGAGVAAENQERPAFAVLVEILREAAGDIERLDLFRRTGLVVVEAAPPEARRDARDIQAILHAPLGRRFFDTALIGLLARRRRLVAG